MTKPGVAAASHAQMSAMTIQMATDHFIDPLLDDELADWSGNSYPSYGRRASISGPVDDHDLDGMRPTERLAHLHGLVCRIAADGARRAAVERDVVVTDAAAVLVGAVERHLEAPADQIGCEARRARRDRIGPPEAERRAGVRCVPHDHREGTGIDEAVAVAQIRTVAAVGIAEQEVRDAAAAEVLQVGARADADDHARAGRLLAVVVRRRPAAVLDPVLVVRRRDDERLRQRRRALDRSEHEGPVLRGPRDVREPAEVELRLRAEVARADAHRVVGIAVLERPASVVLA